MEAIPIIVLIDGDCALCNRTAQWFAARDARGNGWPATFLGCIGNVLDRRAARRKLGGHKYLPAHVGKSQRAREERHLRKLMGIL